MPQCEPPLVLSRTPQHGRPRRPRCQLVIAAILSQRTQLCSRLPLVLIPMLTVMTQHLEVTSVTFRVTHCFVCLHRCTNTKMLPHPLCNIVVASRGSQVILCNHVRTARPACGAAASQPVHLKTRGARPNAAPAICFEVQCEISKAVLKLAQAGSWRTASVHSQACSSLQLAQACSCLKRAAGSCHVPCK